MIDSNNIFNELMGKGAVWCGANLDAGDLAQVAAFVVDNGVDLVSVPAGGVQIVWPWLENKNVRIVSRFYFPNKKITVDQVSDVTGQINAVFKSGAIGAQVFLPYAALDDLVAQTHIIRDDLFFNRDLSIGIDVAEIEAYDWQDLFANLQKINATSLLLVMTKDAGNKSDFVGRLYGMLDAWNDDNKFDLHFAFGPNFMRIEQVLRLVESMRPELNNRLKFWVNF